MLPVFCAVEIIIILVRLCCGKTGGGEGAGEAEAGRVKNFLGLLGAFGRLGWCSLPGGGKKR